MTSCLVSSLVRCSIPRVSFIYRSQFYSTTPLISRTWILRNLISKPCCPNFTRSVSSKNLATENDKIKHADEILLRVLESEIAEHELQKKVLPKDFPFEIIDNPKDGSITLKREYDDEQIQASVHVYRMAATQIPYVSLFVTIEKKVGPTITFFCDLTPNNFQITGVSLKSSENSAEDCFQVPSFAYFSGRLQMAFHEYLAARGFKKSHHDFLYYRLDRKYFACKCLKEFIEK